MELYAVLIKRAKKSVYLTTEDSDGREIVPLYTNPVDAAVAAERADLDVWEIIPVCLPVAG
jgi:hypothetical protein